MADLVKDAHSVYLRVAPGERRVELRGHKVQGTSRTRTKVLAY